MFVFNDFGLILLGSLFFIIMSFLFEKLLQLKLLIRLNLTKYNRDIVYGVYITLISFFIELLLHYIESEFVVSFSALAMLVVLVKRNWISAIFIPLPSIIFAVLSKEINMLTYLMYGCAFVTTIIFICWFLFTKVHKYDLIIIASLIAISYTSGYVLYGFENSFSVHRDLIETTLLAAALGIVLLLIINYATKFSISANLLYESSTYHFDNYYRFEVAKKVIEKEIAEKKIKFGFFVLFSHEYEKSPNIDLNKELDAAFLKHVSKQLGNYAVFFNFANNVNGFFMPIKRSSLDIKKAIEGNKAWVRENSDPIKFLENIFTNVRKIYQTSFNTFVSIDTKAATCIYGIHDSSFEKLENRTFRVLNEFSDEKNIVKIYNPLKEKKFIEEHENIVLMDDSLRLDNFSVAFFPVFSNKKTKTVAFLSTIENISEINLKQSTSDFVKFNNWEVEFDRYFAVRVLEKYAVDKQERLILKYSPIGKSENLNFSEIANKILQFDINPTKIVFYIDDFKNESLITKNIEAAREQGFGIAFKDPINLEFVKQIDPDFIILSPNSFNQEMHYNLDKVIFADIKNNDQLKLAISKDAQLFAGHALQEGPEIKRFSTQNKKYFEEIYETTKKEKLWA